MSSLMHAHCIENPGASDAKWVEIFSVGKFSFSSSFHNAIKKNAPFDRISLQYYGDTVTSASKENNQRNTFSSGPLVPKHFFP